jgi:hypothetical protein
MYDNRVRNIPIKDLQQEEGAHELPSSPEMEPYIKFGMMVMRHASDIALAFASINQNDSGKGPWPLILR